ncbi:MAG: molybdopterin molybdotransferase MoeA [Nitrospirae bacterium]|nr:molybdopterin molybdotransferase MoeA [Nitrospirota bacterium]
MVSVDEALQIVLGQTRRMGKERVPIQDVFGRVLAEEIISRREHPPWDNSAMDGYAVCREDIREATPENPATLNVVGELQAGKMPFRPVGRGEAIQIMTGAPIPPGADAVVRVENTGRAGDQVKVFKPCEKGEHIRLKGEDVKAGDQIIPAGARGRPGEIGLLATAGYASALVYRRPVVTVLATGDELAEPGEALNPGMIVNSNSYALAALVRESGGISVILPAARDREKELESKIQEALSGDIAIVAGGVSKGKYDFVKDVLKSLGCDMKFWQVAMRPGHPMTFWTFREGSGLLFGLPGNPVACMVTFYQFVRPAIRKMMGAREIGLPVAEAELEEDYRKPPGARHFIRAVTIWKSGGYRARFTGDQGSGISMSMAQANSLVVLPEDREKFQAGEKVTVQLLPS